MNKEDINLQRVLDRYQELYDKEPELRVVSANREGDLALLEMSFFIKKELNILGVTPSEKWNWLHRALLLCKTDFPNREIIQFYIDNGVPINAQDMYGMTPLHYALRGKNVEAALVLLEAGANPNLPNRDNLIPLRMCIRYPERLDLLELMLKNGGDVHYFNGKDYLLEAIKRFKGNDPDPKYALFIKKLEEYA